MTPDEAKIAAKAACERQLEAFPEKPQATVIKLAIVSFILDEAGVPKGSEERQSAVKAFMATPSYFGASANTLTTLKLVEKGRESATELELDNV